MKKTGNILLAFFRSNFIRVSILAGLIISFLMRNTLTKVFFGGKSFGGRNPIVQVGLFCIFAAVASGLIFGLLHLSNLFSRNKTRLFLENKDTQNNIIQQPSSKRLMISLFIIGLGIALIYIFNNILPSINTEDWIYKSPMTIPRMIPVGNDFRVGLYRPAKVLVSGGNLYQIFPDGTISSQYPPFVNLISVPFLLLDENSAYLVQVFLIIAGNLICIALAVLLAKKYILDRIKLGESYLLNVSHFLFFAITIYSISSYGFLFSIERGNYDIFALFFTLLSIWVLLKWPKRIWLQIILLSIAVHLKIYPIALFVVLFYKHKWKIIFPSIVINLVLLFILGFQNAIGFLNIIFFNNTSLRSLWVGNHSGYSFAYQLGLWSPMVANHLPLVQGIFTLIPILIWALAVFQIVRKKCTDERILSLTVITLPLMNLIPTISHDYKLALLSPFVIILLAIVLDRIVHSPDWIEYLQLGFVLIALLMIGRSYKLFSSEFYIFENKYLVVLFIECLAAWNVIKRLQNTESTILPNTDT
jgi:hypothetical protein